MKITLEWFSGLALPHGAAARKAAYITGVYIALTGAALLLRPAAVFGLLFNIEAGGLTVCS